MSRVRGLDKQFLAAMRRKMDSGRRNGYVGWDRKWKKTVWNNPNCGGGNYGDLMQGLRNEVTELTLALDKDNLQNILNECADVANYAMMIADYEGCLEREKK